MHNNFRDASEFLSSVNSRHASKKNSNAIYVFVFSVVLGWNSSTLMLQVKWHYC